MENVSKQLERFLGEVMELGKGEYLEIRLLPTGTKIPVLKPMFFASIKEVAKSLPVLLEKQTKGYGIFFGVSTRNAQGGKKEHFSRASVLWADLDAKDFKGGKAEAFERIKAFPLMPTIVLDSGHGFHAYWRLKQNQTNGQVLETYLEALAGALNADSAVCDMTHVMRLPFTKNNKVKDQVVDVRIISFDKGNAYDITQFDFLKEQKAQSDDVLSVNKEGKIAQALSELKEGVRHTNLATVVGKLISIGLKDANEIYALLKLPAEESGYPLHELRSQVDDMCKRYAESNSGDCFSVEVFVEDILALGVTCFHDQYKEPFVLVKTPFVQILPVRQRAFAIWLKSIAWEKYKKPLAGENLSKVLGVFEAKAIFEGKRQETYVRVAQEGEKLYYDLGSGRTVEITAQGWKIVDTTDVFFTHPSHQQPQVLPVSGGNLRDLLGFINYPQDKAKYKDFDLLLLTWVVTAFIPGFPHPALVLHGPNGSAKSTFCALLKSLIDPSTLHLTAPSKSNEDFVITCINHWLVPMDNLSSMPVWLSDALCRAITGGGSSKRQLYTDSDEIVYSFKRVIAINGINLVVDKPDLLSRSLMIGLEAIPNQKRKSEKSFWREFESAKPKILGAIFDVMVKKLTEHPKVNLDEKTRLADFMEWGAAVARGLGRHEGDFVSAFFRNVSHQNQIALEASTVAQVVIEYMKDRPEGVYAFTPAGLFKELLIQAERMGVQKSPDYPKDVIWLWRKINAVRTNLEAVGITPEHEDNASLEADGGELTPRRITLTKVSKNADPAVNAVAVQS